MGLTTHQELKPRDVVDDIICDCCGESCETFDGNYEFLRLNTEWGYGTIHDGERWEARVCENCVIEKLDCIHFEKY